MRSRARSGLQRALDGVRGFVLDIDGTLVHRASDGIHVQPGAQEALAAIHASRRPLAIFTNGSDTPPEAFAAELRAVGLPVADEELLTPLCSVQVYLRAHRPDASILLFGTDVSRDYLLRSGVRVLEKGDTSQPDAVFVAQPDVIGFAELDRAARAILCGARLLTGSYRPAYAGADGPIFSRGAMTSAALSKATGRRPIVVGKPSRAVVQTIRERLGVPPNELAVIGDDVGMDIALGRLGGSRTVLVRSGISGEVELDQVAAKHRPDAVVDGVAELLDWL